MQNTAKATNVPYTHFRRAVQVTENGQKPLKLQTHKKEWDMKTEHNGKTTKNFAFYVGLLFVCNKYEIVYRPQ